MRPPHFILVGTGPYSNRGCEAIVRGTMAILRKEFGPGISATVLSFARKSAISEQAAAERDPAITHAVHEPSGGRWSSAWFHLQWLKLLHPFSDVSCRPRDLPWPARDVPFRGLAGCLKSADAVLQIGGDNYSLDYGWPEPFMAMDRYVQRSRRPLILWGASVGPFDAAPLYARKAMTQHLASMRAILVRESTSLACLRAQGLTNVFPLADPAFAMPAHKPDDSRIGFTLPSGFIGMNFSPLLARYATGGNMTQWIALCTEMVARTLKAVHRPVVLIPHVTHEPGRLDDLSLMHRIREGLANGREHVYSVPGTLSAAETKWVIARGAAFVGARTHATIAAMSSCVPTLSLAYSRKAVGLNQDVFGSQDYCIEPTDLGSPDKVVERLDRMMAAADPIRRHLRHMMPGYVDRAFAAGPLLRAILFGGTPPALEGAP